MNTPSTILPQGLCTVCASGWKALSPHGRLFFPFKSQFLCPQGLTDLMGGVKKCNVRAGARWERVVHIPITWEISGPQPFWHQGPVSGGFPRWSLW